MKSLSTFLFVVFIFYVYGQSFPILPDTFSVDIEINNHERNTTRIITQNYDYVNQRARIITYNETDEAVTHYYFLNTVIFFFNFLARNL